MKTAAFFFAVASTLLTTISAGRASDPPCPVTFAQLKKLNVCELDRLFEQAPPGEIPLGYARGQVLLMTDARCPRVRAHLASLAWKGKHFCEGGEFINQWPGFTALRGKIEAGVSNYDGKPCLVLDYPSDTPLFGNLRDEMREIAPGLYLARLYEKCPCLRFTGYFAIEVCGGCR